METEARSEYTVGKEAHKHSCADFM